ncbi:hypothetical protein GCK72_003397 [Caenorhabditis remanei]|uniref:Uncharacterized protein n=1 Tax=Caenorhabditis remanei TaxID=31234 RepID=A0A6A5HTL8_CAERE|nr:hypothetical protein GCK72_003397 [Caenorhabditis remanei]KAF1771570.1 hypothetical protein GCK72_003397 [Caenorhabditis remanei]
MVTANVGVSISSLSAHIHRHHHLGKFPLAGVITTNGGLTRLQSPHTEIVKCGNGGVERDFAVTESDDLTVWSSSWSIGVGGGGRRGGEYGHGEETEDSNRHDSAGLRMVEAENLKVVG